MKTVGVVGSAEYHPLQLNVRSRRILAARTRRAEGPELPQQPTVEAAPKQAVASRVKQPSRMVHCCSLPTQYSGTGAAVGKAGSMRLRVPLF